MTLEFNRTYCPTCGNATKWYAKSTSEGNIIHYGYQCNSCQLHWYVKTPDMQPYNIEWSTGKSLEEPAPKPENDFQVLDWIRDNGNIVRVHVQSFNLFRVQITPGELGISQKSLRIKGVHISNRALIFKHPACHMLKIQDGCAYLGFDPDMGPPPTVFWDKPNCIRGTYFLMTDKWQQSTIRELDDNQSTTPRWLNLEPPENWQPALFEGNLGYWICLEVGEATEKDSLCDPLKALTSVEKKARKLVKSYGQDLESLGLDNFNWIGHRAWGQFEERWGELQEELKAIKNYLIYRHDEFEDKLKQSYEEIACESWDILREEHRLKLEATYKEMKLPDYKEVAREQAGNFAHITLSRTGQEKVHANLDEFIAFVVGKALKKMPSIEKIESMTLSYRTLPLLLHKAIAQDRLDAAELKKQAAERLAEAEKEENQAEIAKAKRQLELTEIAAQKEAMKQAALENARQQIAEFGNPLEEMMAKVRAEMYQAVNSLKTALTDEGKLSSRQLKQARELINQFQLLNTHGDDELENQLKSLAEKLPQGKGIEDVGDVTEAMSDILRLTQEAAEKVLQPNVAEAYGVGNIRL